MGWRKFGKSLFLPHIAILWFLLPTCAVGLVYSMLHLSEISPIRIGFYALSFYTLTVWCVRIPRIIHFFNHIKQKNRYLQRWKTDVHLRTNVSLSGNVIWNGAYGGLQLAMGIYHNSVWFFALFAYYLSLAIMRFFLVRHTLRHSPGEKIRQELKDYRLCGWIFLFMNLTLSAMMLYMIRQNQTVQHHEITTIAMAAYTFFSLTLAIVNVIRYRKYHSPAVSAAKAISLSTASVSMLTLENTMLATFSDGDMPPRTRTLFLALSGGAISILIIVMAIYMIVKATSKLNALEVNHEK